LKTKTLNKLKSENNEKNGNLHKDIDNKNIEDKEKTDSNCKIF